MQPCKNLRFFEANLKWWATKAGTGKHGLIGEQVKNGGLVGESPQYSGIIPVCTVLASAPATTFIHGDKVDVPHSVIVS